MTNETYEMDEAPVAPESTSDRLVAATPWWFVSFLVHAAVLMMLVFIIAIAEQPPADEVVVVTAPRKPLPEPEIEPPQQEITKTKVPVNEKVNNEIVFPREISDLKPETADESDFREVKGEEQRSDKYFSGLNRGDTLGTGNTGGGPFGPRGKGGKTPGGGGGGKPGEKDPDLAVLLALRWLSRHQNDDGSWSMKTHVRHCGRVARFSGSTCTPDGLHETTQHAGQHNYDVGISGLSLLAFLGAGYTHASKRDVYDGICFGDVVKSGTTYLLRQQDTDGCVGSRDVKEYMYNHAIGALALCEAYGQSGASKLKEPAQKAIDFLMSSQNAGMGWRYTHQMGVNDSSVTGWAVMALKSADLAGLTFDKGVAYDGARAWFTFTTFKVPGGGTGNSIYKTGYEAPVDAYVAINGVNDMFNDHPAMSAVALMSRIFMDKKKTAEVHGGAEAVFNDLPRWDAQALDYYYWYYGSLALYQYDGPTGPKWRAWSGKMIDALVDHQNLGKASDKEGSWEPVDRWSCRGGRVYATAINALTLETAYRYSSVFGGGKGE